jgi:hypothetical protein
MGTRLRATSASHQRAFRAVNEARGGSGAPRRDRDVNGTKKLGHGSILDSIMPSRWSVANMTTWSDTHTSNAVVAAERDLKKFG